MSQENDDPEELPLPANQQAALESLLSGETMETAAQAAGVRRETVSRWLSRDWVFQAAYNRELRGMQQRAFGRLYGLVDGAVETVEKAITGGDVRSAVAVLRGLGLLRGFVMRPGSDNPERLEAEEEIAASRLHERWMQRVVKKTH